MKRDLLLDRRRLLQLCGGVAALMTPISRLRAAEAGIADTTLRFIFIRTPNGTHRDAYWPVPVAMPAGSPAIVDLTKVGAFQNARLSEILEPLYAHRADLSVLKGVSLPRGGISNQHYEGCAQLLTNSRMVPKDGLIESIWSPSKASIDQMIAARHQGLVAMPSLNLLYPKVSPTNHVYELASYRDGGVPVSQTGDLAKVFSDLFSLFGADATRVKADLVRGKSVLDYTLDEIKRLQGELTGEERAKLEQHMESVRSLEINLVKQLDDVQKKSDRCPPAFYPTAKAFKFARPRLALSDLDLMVDLTLAAFSCDLTRVVNMVWVHEGGANEYFQEDFGYDDIRSSAHSMSHYYQDQDILDKFQKEFPGESLTQIKARARAAGTSNLIRLQKTFAGKVARLLTGLKGMDALQQSAVLWGSGMADGSHAQDELPLVLAGHAGGRLKQGQFIDYKQTRTNAGLLLSLADAYGIKDASGKALSHFGDEDLGVQVRMPELLK